MAQRIQLRRGTAAEWTAANPVLAVGEPGVERDTGRLKLGDGVTAWATLPYASQGAKGDQGAPGVADDASMAAIAADPDSEFRGELSATIGDQVSTPGTAARTALDATYVAPDDVGRDKLKAVNADKLRPFYAALADRAASPLDVLFIGDSISEGEGSGTITSRWISRFIASMRAQFQPQGIAGGRGYIPSWYAQASPAPATAGFTPSGSGVAQATTYGLGRRSVSLSTGGTLTITVNCTSFDVVYPKQTSGGVFSVAIDGGAPVNVDTTAAGALGGQKQRFTPTLRGPHQIVISYVSGTPMVEGIMVYDGDENLGVRLWDGAHYGYTSSAFSSLGLWAEGMKAFTADLVVLALGTNDHGTNVAPATYKTNMQTIIATIRAQASGVPIVLVGMFERAGAFTYQWSAYLTALREIAAADSSIVMVDLTRRMAKGSTTDPYGFITSDGVHPSAKGHQIMADFISGTVLDGVRGGVTLDGIVDATGNIILANTKALTLQKTVGTGNNGRIFVNAANQLDIQMAGGSLRVANNAYNSILLEISDSGTITIGGGPQIRNGNGSPEGVVSAPVGSMYLRKDGGAGTSHYIKEAGTGNTGWVAK
jgi:lysophospholipase L1-like esterase